MTTAPTTTPKPKRRWFQYSLRTMMVVMLLISVPLGWLAYKVRQAREQREAVRAIEKLGGSVGYADVSDDGVLRAAIWLGTLFGEHLSPDVTLVMFDRTKVSDAELKHLRGLTQLKALVLDCTQISDAGLVHLQGLPQLQYLHLTGTQVSDVGLIQLRGLTQLQWPVLLNTGVSDAGLTHLRGLTQLEWLYLGNTRVTDAGVAELQKALPNCRITR